MKLEILLVIANVLLFLIWYQLYSNRKQQSEMFRFRQQEKQLTLAVRQCTVCMQYVNEWWTKNIVEPQTQKKLTDQEVQQAYDSMLTILLYLVAPCMLGWWNESPTMAIQNARGLKGLQNLELQVKNWWKTNVFEPNKFNETQIKQVQEYLVNSFNDCVAKNEAKK
jgi:hypothetical protein